MNELDDGLKKIQSAIGCCTYHMQSEEFMDEIKQAFKDAGYIQSQDLLNLHAQLEHELIRLQMVPEPTSGYHDALLDSIKKETGLMTGQEILANFIRKRVLYGTDFDDHATRVVYECQVCRDVVGLFTKKNAVEHYRSAHLEPKPDHQAILTKAVQKAINGGWSGDIADKVQSIVDEDIELLLVPERNIYNLGPINFIFSHEFAKALLGDWDVVMSGRVYDSNGTRGGSDAITTAFCGKNWQWHLQQMVITPDPIKYLGEHLDD